MATSNCKGALSKEPCTCSVPLGADGRPCSLLSAYIVPLGEPRSESVEVSRAVLASEVLGPSRSPEALRVPASAGDRELRSETSRDQRACRIAGL